jgi:trehalose-phosphatase
MIMLSDYDGTLTRIARTPAQARLPAARRALLARLSRLPGVRLGFISGRSLRELRRMVAVPGAVYVGNHGLEVQGRGLSFVHPKARAARPLLRRLAQRLEQALQDLPGAWVEWKGLTISVHWRAVPRSAQQAFHRCVRLVTREERARRRIRLTTGKRVVEVRPNVPWGKGESIGWLWRRMRRHRAAGGASLVYFGDDRTDEDAFRTVNRLGGVSVFVGRSPARTSARYRMRDPRDVQAWLATWSQHRSVTTCPFTPQRPQS